MAERHLEYLRLDDITRAPRNPKMHATHDIKRSIDHHGMGELPLMDERTGRLVAGHGRLDQLIELHRDGRRVPDGIRVDADGMWMMPVIRGWASKSDEDAEAYLVASNHLTAKGGWDDRDLVEMLGDLQAADMLALTGYTDDDLTAMLKALDGGTDEGDYDGVGAAGSLAERFMIPPFTVLDGRQGWWRDRKRAWIRLGIESGETREHAQTSGSLQGSAQQMGVQVTQGASQFDPVLCEVAYRWWCPPGGTILDPFAGGSVRGIVAAQLGRHYTGVDLRQDQVEANRRNAATVVDTGKPMPTWHTGDATEQHLIDGLPTDVDLVFSCPPYADLEVYSDDPRDLSTMPYPKFRAAHAEAIRQACDRLRDDAFAVWVIGEARGKDGELYGLIPDTVAAFRAAGLAYTTEAVLLTPLGHAPIRAARGFTATRALARAHQNVLVFCKGDKKRATDRLGPVDVTEALDAVAYDPGEDDYAAA